jgi:ribosomal protein S8E
MSQLSKMTHSRNQWKEKTKQHGKGERYERREKKRIKAERDRLTQALKASEARVRDLKAQLGGLTTRPKVEVVHLALQLFLEARISFRAVSRVLALLAQVLGIGKAPCAQTIINWVIRLSIVRIEAARTVRGLPLHPAPFSNGLIWMIDISIGLGSGKILAVLALDAHHHQLVSGAPTLSHAHCLGVAVADSWTGDTIAEVLKQLIATLGRPAAYLKDAGSDLHKAAELLAEPGLASPCIDDVSHTAAGMLKRYYQHHPAFERFVSACGRVSGKLKQTLLACLAPPTVRTKARFMNVHRLFTWAERILQLSPAGGAKAGSILARLRACLDELPACKDLIKRFRGDAQGLLECQKILKTKGLCHDTRAQCEPLIDAMPSSVVRQALRAYLLYQLDIAKTLGLDHIGMPISSDTIESLFGVGKHHGMGQTQDAARIALRLPAFCGAPTREEAQEVLTVSVAQQRELTAHFTTLTQQRREVFGHPERLESLSRSQGQPHVELLPSPKNRSNCETAITISKGCENPCGPQFECRDDLMLMESTGPPDIGEAALTS